MIPKRISLRTKLLGGFGAVLAITALLGVIALSKMGAIEAGTQSIQQKTVQSVKLIGELQNDVSAYRRTQLEHVTASSPQEMTELAKVLKDAGPEMAADFKVYGEKYVDAGTSDADVMNAVKEDWDRYAEQTAGVVTASSAGRDAEAMRILEGAQKHYDELEGHVAEWTKHNVAEGDRVYAEAQATAESARTLTIVLLAIALVLGAAVALFISTQIRRGVTAVLDRLSSLRDNCATDLEAALTAMAGGDLTVGVTPVTAHIEKWSSDEIGDVAQATNSIRDKMVAAIEGYNGSRGALNRMIGEVADTATSVAAASEEVAPTSEEAGRAVQEIASAVGEVAQGAQRQVGSVESARAVAEQVSTVTAESATSAQSTAEAAEQARVVATEGQEAVGKASEAMTAVRDASAEASEAIRGLGSKSEEIGGIVATITGIAEQTNLLALNAAIEAARAGEQGRGFAVVAEEVRKLAEESQSAAASIGQLIDEIQTETGKAIDVVESSAGRTQEGVETVEHARRSFEQIGASVDDVTGRIGDIAAAVQQIASSAERMRLDMEEVSSVAEQTSASSQQVSASTEETSASTQEIAGSAQELARAAEQLETLVGQFKR
jgi:methyl-accepting chemotaxis protein